MFRSVTRRRLVRSLRSFDARFFSGDVLAAYQEKLQKKAALLGVDTVHELKERLKPDIEATKARLNKIDPIKELEQYAQRQQQESRDDASTTTKIRLPIPKDAKTTPYKTLSSFVDVGKLAQLPRKELELIWKARFANVDRAMSAVLDATQFSKIYATAFKNPSFILPVPKGPDGYEMHFVQWSFVGPNTTYCLLTTVAEYKLHKEYAKPHTTLMFHQELAQPNAVVLMNGIVEEESSLTMEEAHLLVLNVQRFYSGLNDTEASQLRAHLLQQFSKGDADFDMKTLVQLSTTVE